MLTRKIRVLIVEDNLADAELLTEYLRETGAEVQIAMVDDGQKAIDYFQRVKDSSDEKPDLVLMDLNLPKRSGHEVLDIIRRSDGGVRVMIYSGSESPRDIGRAKVNKADGYMVKPMTTEEINQTVKRLREILSDILV